MLIEAKLVEDELTETLRRTKLRDPDRFRFYRLGSGARHLPPIEDSDWVYIERASVLLKKDEPFEVLGFLSAQVDRDTNSIIGLDFWSTRTSKVFTSDCWGFLEDLRRQFGLIRFEAIIGGAPSQLWTRCVARMGGKITGRQKATARLRDGKLYDTVLVEIPGENSLTCFEESDDRYSQLLAIFEAEKARRKDVA